MQRLATAGLDQVECWRNAAREDEGVDVEDVLQRAQTQGKHFAHHFENRETRGFTCPRTVRDVANFACLAAQFFELSLEAGGANIRFEASRLAADTRPTVWVMNRNVSKLSSESF